MRKLHDISTSSGQKKPKIRGDLKKNTSEKESEVKMNSKLCMLTSATQANKLKQELQSYGFGNSVLK